MTLQSPSVGDVFEWQYDESPDSHHQYMLRRGDQVMSILRLEHAHDDAAVAELDGHRLLFKRRLIQPFHIEVQEAGAGATVAILDFNIAVTGELRLANGNTYHLVHENIFVPTWSFTDNAKQPYVTITAHFGFHKPSATVTITPVARAHPDRMLVATLLWYVVLMTNLYPTFMLNR
jgi:hypothetical protein